MFNFDNFIIAPLVAEDAFALNTLMLTNATRFQAYFPKTLEANVTLEKSSEFIKMTSEDFLNQKQLLFALKTKTAIAGLIYIKEIDWENKKGEFAYCIGSEFSGQGCISKGVAKLSEYAFTELGLESLIIITHKSNLPSVKIAQKNHFQFIKTLKNEYTPPGKEPLDMELYELRK